MLLLSCSTLVGYYIPSFPTDIGRYTASTTACNDCLDDSHTSAKPSPVPAPAYPASTLTRYRELRLMRPVQRINRYLYISWPRHHNADLSCLITFLNSHPCLTPNPLLCHTVAYYQTPVPNPSTKTNKQPIHPIRSSPHHCPIPVAPSNHGTQTTPGQRCTTI